MRTRRALALLLVLGLGLPCAVIAQEPPQKPPSPPPQDDAIANLRARLQVNPDDTGIRYELAEALERAGKLQEAILEFRLCTQLNSREVRCHLALGEALQKVGDFQGGLAAFRDAVQADRLAAEAHRRLLHGLFSQGDFSGLDEALRFALQVLPANEEFLKYHGLLLYLKAPATRAAKEFQLAAQSAANPAEVHTMMCGMLQGIMALEAAEQERRQASSLAANDPKLLKELESLRVQQERLAPYLAEMRADAAQGKLDAFQWKPYLLWLYMNADFREFLVAAPQWLRTRPEDAETLYYFVLALILRMGKGKAVSQLEDWGRDPQLSAALIALAVFQERGGDLTSAVARLREAIRRDPDSFTAHRALARVLTALGEVAEAEVASKAAQELEERTPGASAVNEASAVGSLRSLNTVCVTYFSVYGAFPPDLKSLTSPPPNQQPSASAADLIDPVLASGRKRGYLFEYVPVQDEQRKVVGYAIYADPVVSGVSGYRYFYTDQSGVIRSNTGARASASSPPL